MSFPLQVGMEAKLDQLEKDFDKAADLAGQAVEKIEEKFSESNPTISTDALATALGGIAGGGAILAIIGLFTEVNKQLAEMGDNARRVAATTDEFQAWVYALRTGGASAKEASDAIQAIATKLNDARRGGNDFTEMLEANNKKWKDQNGEIINVNTALAISQGLIRNAATELDKIKIGEKLGLSKEATDALDRMPGTFDQIAAKARAAGAVVDEGMIQKAQDFRREWNDAALQWETWFKRAGVGITGTINSVIDLAKGFSDWLDDLARREEQFESDLVKRITGRETRGALEHVGALFADQSPPGASFAERFGDQVKDVEKAATSAAPAIENLFATMVKFFDTTKADQARVEKLIGGAIGVVANLPPTKFPDKKEDDDDKKDAFDTASDRIERRRKLYEAQAQAIGQVTRERERARVTADLEAAAERTDAGLTEERKKQIDEMARAYGEAAEKAALAKQKFDGINQAVVAGGDEIIRVFDGLRTGTLTWDSALKQATNTLITMLERAALLGQGPLAVLLGTAAAPGTGGVGGLLGSIFGGARAGGGDVEAGKTYMVGEEGPELLRMGGNGTVLPNHVVNSYAGGSSAMHFHAHFEAPTGSFDPAAAEAMMGTLRRGFQDMMSAHAITQLRSGGLFRPNI